MCSDDKQQRFEACPGWTYNFPTQQGGRCDLANEHDGPHRYVHDPAIMKPSLEAFVNHSKVVPEAEYEAAKSRLGELSVNPEPPDFTPKNTPPKAGT